MHQDVLSEHFCGDGIPVWAVDSDNSWDFPVPIYIRNFTYDQKGIPSEAECNSTNWANYYSTDAVGSAFQSLYDNRNGIRDAMGRLWQRVAQVWSNSEWLLGYEFLNEPWAGDHLANPSLMFPGVADRENLVPFYEAMHSAIREADSERIVMFEPIPWDNWASAGFAEVPGGSNYRNRSVFAYHYYRPPDMEDVWSYIEYRMKDVQRLRTAGFMTEFASTWPVVDNASPEHDLEGIRRIVEACENHTQSWSGWQMKVFHGVPGRAGTLRYPRTPGDFSMYYPNGTVDERLVGALSRPYAMAVAGRITHNRFTTHSGNAGYQYTLVYSVRKSSQLPTEIYVNSKFHFPNGIEVKVTPDDWGTATLKGNIVTVVHGDAAVDGGSLTVVLEAPH